MVEIQRKGLVLVVIQRIKGDTKDELLRKKKQRSIRHRDIWDTKEDRGLE